MQTLFSLEGQTALVTGARSGIGQAIAVGFAQAGADVVLLGHQDNLQQTQELIKQAGRQSQIMLLDLAQRDQIEPACQELLARQPIDILVNSAGITSRQPAIDYSREDWDRVVNINLNAVFALTQQIARPMLARRRGKIISIASMASFQGGINVVAYAASKHGVAGMTKALANEWAAQGVQVNAIAPGYILTDLTRILQQNETRNQMILSRIPAGRWGSPGDLVGAAIFLASAASDYVNGHILPVDGGWMSW
jgi:2-deoxy-D-gluconate 3-dehydrogenase